MSTRVRSRSIVRPVNPGSSVLVRIDPPSWLSPWLSGSTDRAGANAPAFAGSCLEQLCNPLVGDPQDATSVSHCEVSSLDQVCCHGRAHCHRLRLQNFCLYPHFSRASHLSLKVARQDRLDLDIKRIGRDGQEESYRVANHGIGFFEAARLRIDPFQLWNADRPPVAYATATSGICLQLHFLHHPRPNSSSTALKTASAVNSLISRCRGTVTFVSPHCHTS